MLNLSAEMARMAHANIAIGQGIAHRSRRHDEDSETEMIGFWKELRAAADDAEQDAWYRLSDEVAA